MFGKRSITESRFNVTIALVERAFDNALHAEQRGDHAIAAHWLAKAIEIEAKAFA